MRFPWQKKTDMAPGQTAPNLTPDIAADPQEIARAVVSEIQRELVSSSPSMIAPNLTPDGTQHGIYKWDNPYNWSIPQPPTRRPGSSVSLMTLRALADNYDPLRAGIQHLKREVMAVPLQVVAKEEKDKSRKTKRAIADATEFITTIGGLGGIGVTRAEFESSLLDDLLIVGAAATYYHPTLDGGVFTVEAIDAATIRPRVDAYGWPGPGEYAYEQWVLGILIAGFTREQMDFRGAPTNTRTYTPYPASPVEWLINAINSAIRADDWNRQWLINGNTPADIIALPDDWSPQMVRDFADYWDSLLTGDSSARQKTKFVPGNATRMTSNGRKDQDFEVFELWLLRRICAVLGVQPASIGFAGEQYKVSQQDSMQSTSYFGAGVLLEWRKTFYDDLFRRMGIEGIEAQNISSREEDATERATRNFMLTGVPVKTINEARTDEGLDPIEGGDVLLVPYGTIPLEQALQPPTDPNADPSADPNADPNKANGTGQTDGPQGDPFAPPSSAPGKPTANRAAGLQRADVEFINKDGKVIPMKPGGGGKASAGSATAGKAGGGKTAAVGANSAPTAPGADPPQQTPTDAARSARAKKSAVLIDKVIQRYSEEHNEPQLAKATAGLSLQDNEPVDVIVMKSGIMQHGIELKTMVSNKSDKITMKKESLQRKRVWQQDNFAPFHTVVFDDRDVYNANGPGQHNESARKIFYRRGAGSFRVPTMHQVADISELNSLLSMPDADLPPAARAKGWPAPPVRGTA